MNTLKSQTIKKYIFTLVGSLIVGVAMIGCGDHDHDHNGHSHNHHKGHSHNDHGDHESELEPVVITQYTSNSELFLEHLPLVRGKPSPLIVHLTRLADFTPITRGTLEVRLISDSGNVYSVTSPHPDRDGIFLPEIIPPFAGVITMELILQSPQMDTVHRIETVPVYPSESDIPHALHAEDMANTITFLKEQQWRIDFATEPAGIGSLAPAIKAYGTLRLPPAGKTMIVAPVNGLIGIADEFGALEIGQSVGEDVALFAITSDAGWSEGMAKLREEYLLARLELNRVQELFHQEAVAQKRVEEATIKLHTLTDALERFGVDVESVEASSLRALARTPRSGILAEIYVYPGQRVAAGDPLALVEDPTRLLLEASLPVTRLKDFFHATDAIFYLDNRSTNYRVSELGGSVVSAFPMASEQPGIARFLFPFNNPHPMLMPGSKVTVHVLGDSGDKEVIIPLQSVNEEQGQPLVYVHTAGESIEKRYPRLGPSDGRHVVVLAGVEAGERVVTRGANAIRLASMSTTEMGHGHAH